MTRPVSGLDHLLAPVNDLGAAAARVRKLGFTVSPRGVHSPHLGSANHTIVFRRNYMELLGIVTPTAFNAMHRENLARGEGVHAVAITVEDLAALADGLTASGIDLAAPVAHSRPVDLPGGPAEASFVVVRPDRAQLPAGFMFYCRHDTPELVWRPEWMMHANTAETIDGVVIAAEDPQAAAAVYSKILFASPVAVDGGCRVPSGKADFDFLTPAALDEIYGAAQMADIGSPFYKVVRIAVGDPERARAVLQTNDVPCLPHDGSLLIPARAGGGILFQFVAAAHPSRP